MTVLDVGGRSCSISAEEAEWFLEGLRRRELEDTPGGGFGEALRPGDGREQPLALRDEELKAMLALLEEGRVAGPLPEGLLALRAALRAHFHVG